MPSEFQKFIKIKLINSLFHKDETIDILICELNLQLATFRLLTKYFSNHASHWFQ